MSVDEELAINLQRNLNTGLKDQIDEDAEIARRLQEEEERELKAKLEMDTQLALMMQVCVIIEPATCLYQQLLHDHHLLCTLKNMLSVSVQ